MKKVLLISTLIILLGCTLLPFDIPTMKDWKLKGKVQSYHPGNLWEIINGAADAFISFGFQELKSYDVEKGDLMFTVNIYDMGSPMNAYGMYRTENSPKDDSVKIGSEAQFTDYMTVMLKGSYYIKLETVKGKTSRVNSEPLLQELQNSLKGSNEFPAELTLLPKGNKVKHSEKYIKENFLGVQELSNCLYAKYKDGDLQTRIFIILPGEGETKEDVLKKLSEKWTPEKYKNHTIYSREIPYTGTVGVCLNQDRIIGISGYKTKEEMTAALSSLLK